MGHPLWFFLFFLFKPFFCDISVQLWRDGLSVTDFPSTEDWKTELETAHQDESWLHALFCFGFFSPHKTLLKWVACSCEVGLTSAGLQPSVTEPHAEDQITVRTPSTGESQKDTMSHLFVICEGDAGESQRKPQRFEAVSLLAF